MSLSNANSVILKGKTAEIQIKTNIVIGKTNSKGILASNSYVSSIPYSVVEAKFNRNTGILTLTNSKEYTIDNKAVYKEFKTGNKYSKNRINTKEYNLETRNYKIKSGLVSNGIKDDGRTISINLNIKNAKIIKGDTYNHKDYIKKQGFKWDKDNKYWIK